MVVDVKNPVYDYNWLCNMMQERKVVAIVGPDGNTYKGVINGIKPEDGSGNKWIVTIYSKLISNRVFVRAS